MIKKKMMMNSYLFKFTSIPPTRRAPLDLELSEGLDPVPLISSLIPAITIVIAHARTAASVYELRMRIPMHQTSGSNSIPAT